MNEKKRKTIIYIIFAAAVIWGIFNNPFGHKKNLQNNINNIDNPVDMLVDAEGETVDAPALDSNSNWGRDPFLQKSITRSQADPVSSEFELSAISESGGVYWALIDGQVLKAGDKIEGWTVSKVDAKQATLLKNGNIITLKMEGI